jgi:hypothetical protein
MNRVILILGALAVVLIAIAIVTSKKARVQYNPGEIILFRTGTVTKS